MCTNQCVLFVSSSTMFTQKDWWVSRVTHVKHAAASRKEYRCSEEGHIYKHMEEFFRKSTYNTYNFNFFLCKDNQSVCLRFLLPIAYYFSNDVGYLLFILRTQSAQSESLLHM